MAPTTERQIILPEPFQGLFRPARYKAFYGGRGSGKSHSLAQAIVLLAYQRPIRVLCCREIQNSIRDSVKRLLDDKIERAGLKSFFRSTDTQIRGRNGSLFTFAGLRTNPDSIKSTEGIDIAWVEEANTVSQRSLELLIPTVRKPGSEIWFGWNPRFEKDPVDKMFRGGPPPPDSIVRRVNWDGNPWFPKVLREKMDWDRVRDPDKYAHVWLGEYLKNSEARVFKNWVEEKFETPLDAEFYYGADWGFSVDPTVLVRCWIKDRTLFVDQEVYDLGVEIDHLPAFFAGSAPAGEWVNPRAYKGMPGAHRWPIRGDSASPQTISYLRNRGFNIEAAVKGMGSVEEGVEFLRSYDIKVHPRCRHTIDELTLYSYKVDKQTDRVLPVLADKDNHVIDALRYSIEPLRIAMASQGMFDLMRREAHEAEAQAERLREGGKPRIDYAAGSMEAFMAAQG